MRKRTEREDAKWTGGLGTLVAHWVKAHTTNAYPNAYSVLRQPWFKSPLSLPSFISLRSKNAPHTHTTLFFFKEREKAVGCLWCNILYVIFALSVWAIEILKTFLHNQYSHSNWNFWQPLFLFLPVQDKTSWSLWVFILYISAMLVCQCDFWQILLCF